MKGIIFNLLEEIVRREYGEDTWDALLETSHLDGSYTSLGNYPEEQLQKLVAAASIALAMPPAALIRWFGRHAIPLLAVKYPRFFVAHQSPRRFLLSLNDIIHTEVRKLYPGADVPIFDYDTSSPEVLLMGYKSPRRLCLLAEGFIEGVAVYYGEAVQIEQLTCMHRGDERCLFKISL